MTSQKDFKKSFLTIFYIWISLLVIEFQCLLISNLHIPPVVLLGDNVTLKCSYDLQGEPLYMVKWYKGQNEFFRFVPKELPPKQVFPTRGIHVNVSQSDEHQVALMYVQKITRGKFRVEITTDAPLFYTAIESSHLEIIEPPTGEVTLLVEDTNYSLGDNLRATCRSAISDPPMNITWLIQGQPIRRGHASVHRITQRLIEESSQPLFTTESTLNYQVNWFRHGKFRLVCEASLYNVLRREAYQDIYEKKTRVSPVIQNEGSSGVCSFGLNLQLFLCLSMAKLWNQPGW